MTRVLVTGGAGFIGSHVVDRMLREGFEVRVVDNLSTGDERNLAHVADRIEFQRGDLTDPAACRKAVEGIEVIFHLAALPSVPRSMKDPLASHQHNADATVHLLLAARDAKVRRIVFSGSSSVYGDTPTLPKVETMEALPRSPYAAAKLAAEQYVLAFARAGLIEGVALRYFNVFGPRVRIGTGSIECRIRRAEHPAFTVVAGNPARKIDTRGPRVGSPSKDEGRGDVSNETVCGGVPDRRIAGPCAGAGLYEAGLDGATGFCSISSPSSGQIPDGSSDRRHGRSRGTRYPPAAGSVIVAGCRCAPERRENDSGGDPQTGRPRFESRGALRFSDDQP
ncbi:MAG: SDR family NAD(P)-dependent oxidoreductase [Gemmatimonadales bacterium]